MRNLIRVAGHENLVRDADTKAVLTIDQSGLSKYREERSRLLRLEKVAEDVDNLKSEIGGLKDTSARIESMLRSLLGDKNVG